ncbi:MAG: flagellar export protein FliJ [Oceanobacter sp.]
MMANQHDNEPRLLHERSPRIRLVLQQTRSEEAQAMRQWSQYQQTLAQEQEQLAQLKEYAEGYRNSLAIPSQTKVSGGQIHHTLGFLQQVEQAIQTQHSKIYRLQDQLQTARSRYLTLRGKVKGMENLIEKLEREKAQQLEKQEQKQVDEFNNRMYFR